MPFVRQVEVVGSPVAGFGGDYVADAAAGVGDVAGVAGGDVEMDLRDGLPGRGSVVGVEAEGVGSSRRRRSLCVTDLPRRHQN